MFTAFAVKSLRSELFHTPEDKVDPKEAEVVNQKFEYSCKVLRSIIKDVDPEKLYKLYGLFRRIHDGVFHRFSLSYRMRACAQASGYSEHEAKAEYVREMELICGPFTPEMYEPKPFRVSKYAVVDCHKFSEHDQATLYVRENNIEALKNYLKSNPDLEGEDTSLLHHAADFNSIQCAKLLLDHGINPCLADIEGMTPMDIALANNYDDIMDLLRKYGGD